jgi:hypothetical protein
MGILKWWCGARTVAMAAAVCVATVLWLGAGSAAADNTIVVNTTQTTYTQGDGLCALGEAVDYANGGSDPDCSTAARSGTTTIELPAGKYEVPGTLELDDPTDLVGAGATETDLDGGGAQQVLNIDSTATVSVSNLAITGGMSDAPSACTPVLGTPCFGTDGGDGGGIMNLGKLTLSSVTVSGNQTAAGSEGSYVHEHSCGNCQAVPGLDGGDGGQGGGIYNGTGATLTIANSTISGNATGAGAAGIEGFSGGGSDAGPGVDGGEGGDGGYGGAIYNETGATLSISGSMISANTTGVGGVAGPGSDAAATPSRGGDSGEGGDGGGGAGIFNNGALSITGSTLSDNAAGAGGNSSTAGSGLGGDPSGGVDQAGDGGSGVAIVNASATTTPIVDSTFSGNAAGAAGSGQSPGNPGEGGAIDNLDFAGTDLTDVTIADNTASVDAAISGPGGRPLIETNSIIAANTNTVAGSESCNSDQIVDGGHNLAYQASGCAGVTGDPKLGPLADNGGPTQTMALAAGSAAVDLVPVSACTVTTDQRGLHRPAGSACDAGAYEVSPPAFSGTQAVADGPASASVSGQVTANLTDTKLTVHYGTSTNYGSTTSATDVGSSSDAKSFSITLTGLTASTGYHVQVVATNADGTSSTSDMTITTAIAAAGPVAQATASVAHATVTGNVVLVSLACAKGGSICSGALKLSSRVTTKGKKIVAVAAAAGSKKKAKRKTVTRTVGSGRYSITAGQTKVIKLTLNAYGKRLLKARGRLPTMLTITGPARLTKKVTFIYKRSRNKKR